MNEYSFQYPSNDLLVERMSWERNRILKLLNVLVLVRLVFENVLNSSPSDLFVLTKIHRSN